LKMFDEKDNIDFKGILEGAQEEVPASVWEGVSACLDKAARGKVVALWFRRAGIATVAAAAIAGMLLVLPNDNSTDIVPGAEDSNMIAVVENDPVIPADTAETAVPEMIYVAKAEPVKFKAEAAEQAVQTETPAADAGIPADTAEEPDGTEDCHASGQERKSDNTGAGTAAEWKDEWAEVEEPVRKKKNASFILSGLTGTNAAQNETVKDIFKRPDPNPGPATTGVTQTSTNSAYGIPVSFGAGVRIGLSSKWSIGAGVNYSMLSRNFYGTYTKVGAGGTIENSTSSDIRNTQHYIGIPVNAYYDIVDSRNVNFYAYAGGTVEKCISDKYSVLNTSIIHKEKVDGFQWSANVGIGVGFKLSKHLGLYIDPSLRYYFDNGQPHSIRSAQPLMLGFEVGLKLYL
jgi:hypothetical protein